MLKFSISALEFFRDVFHTAWHLVTAYLLRPGPLLLLAACAVAYVLLKRRNRKVPPGAAAAFSFGALLDPVAHKPVSEAVKFKQPGDDDPFCEPTDFCGSGYGIKA
jgi:hypothetical protein